MKYVLFRLLFFSYLTPVANAESYICSYPSYADDGNLIILKIEIDGDVAIVSGSLTLSPDEYRVMENNDIGLVLIQSFAAEGDNSPSQHDILLDALLIDKANMKMARGHLTLGDDVSSYREGNCRT